QASALSYFASALGTGASISSGLASIEEKQLDWNSQLQLAQQDVIIGMQQQRIAQDQQSIAGQEVVVSQLSADHAQATLEYLAGQFTNADLYAWMSGVLGDVYAHFLNQATATARLAEAQLAFERQQPSLSIIKTSYWQPLPTGNATTGTSGGN